MAKMNGSIFGRARNSIGGVTFLKGLAREGTQQTARQKVKPNDPRSNAQKSQRSKMSFAVANERLMGIEKLKPMWDSAISKLPAYQSFMSYLLNSMRDSDTVPKLGYFTPVVGKGDLHYPETIALNTPSSGNWSLNWSDETGENGSPDDRIYIFEMGIQENTEMDNPIIGVAAAGSYRSDKSQTLGTTDALRNYGGLMVATCFVRYENNVITKFSKIHTFAEHLTLPTT